MSNNTSSSPASSPGSSPGSSPTWLRRLQTPPRIDNLDPVAARFIYALRLMAVYQNADRDPAAELAVRLESVTAAVRAMELSQAILRAWPECVSVNRFCCKMLSHDEMTIGAMMTASAARDRQGFDRALCDLVRPERIARLWEQCVQLVGVEQTPR